MTQMTDGQAACIAWNAHYAEEHGIEARNEWAASDPRGRGAWEAAAKAAQAPLRDAMAQLADEMFAEAQVIASAPGQPDEMPDMADQIRAEVLHETASRIRAGLPS